MSRRIYLDLDGVMADFDGTFPSVFGLDHRDLADDAMWLHINGLPSFFRDLPPMNGAVEFFRTIEHLDPIILTACPKSNYAHVATQKVEWVRAHLSAHVTVLPVLGGSSKPLFMHAKGDILIDDFRRNTEAWSNAGGHAILHRGFDGTAAALEEVIGPYTPKPAQPVEAVGAFAPIPEAEIAPTPELWRAYEAFNGEYKGFNTQQALRAAINGVLAERAALAHPRPTDHIAESRNMAAPTGEQAGELVTDEMIDRAMTAYDEQLLAADEAQYDAMEAALKAVFTQPRPMGVPMTDADVASAVEEVAKIIGDSGFPSALSYAKARQVLDLLAAAPAPGKGGEA
jgi:hypothetical protein